MNIVPDYNAAVADYMKDGVLHVSSKGFSGNVQIETTDDLTALSELKMLAPGTLAHMAGYQNIWELGTDGTWAVVKE